MAESVAVGVLSSLLADLISSGANQMLLPLKRSRRKDGGRNLGSLQKALARHAKSLEGVGPHIECYKAFLVSAEAEAIVRRLFAARLTSNVRPVDDEAFLEGLHQGLVSRCGRLAGEIEDCRQLLEILAEGVDEALENQVELGSLAAHDLRSAVRGKIILDELKALDTRLAKLVDLEEVSSSSVDSFSTDLRRQIAQRHGFITPPHFDYVKRIAISKLHVLPVLRKFGGGTDADVELTYPEFLKSAYRVVVLGDPGGGKSTLANRIAFDIASHGDARLFGSRRLVPVVLVLREYGEARRTLGGSILDFMVAACRTRYQLEVDKALLVRMLHSGQLLVILDGLDELLDTGFRREVTGDVNAFASQYPGVPVLVTSRRVGYTQAPLNEEAFLVYDLAPFQEVQVAEYARKWFELDEDLAGEERSSRAASFVEESGLVPDLRANPLMLALMCNIYRGERYIPQNKPEVYEKCALMLFERWDRARSIRVDLPFEAHLRPAMMFIAAWIYEDERRQSGVTEKELATKAAEYLSRWRYPDPDEALAAASAFVEFCRGRAWVFTDTGTTSGGVRLYQFTHQTFLEYFTAGHLARVHERAEELSGYLLPFVARGEWEVVAQLAFQIKSRSSERAADSMLLDIVTEAKGDRRSSRNLLAFAIRGLESIVPSPHTIQEIIEAALEWCMSDAVAHGNSDRRIQGVNGGWDLLESVRSVSKENAPLVAEVYKKWIEKKALAVEPCSPEGHTLCELIWSPSGGPSEWRESEERLRESSPKFFQQVARCNVLAAQEEVFAGRMSVAQYFLALGWEQAFSEYQYRVAPNVSRVSLVESILSRLANGEEVTPEALTRVRELGEVLRSKEPPWIDLEPRGEGLFFIADEFDTVLAQCPEDETFVPLAVAAVSFELGLSRSLNVGQWSVLFQARNKQSNDPALLSSIRPVPGDKTGLLAEWAHGRLNLVGGPTGNARQRIGEN